MFPPQETVVLTTMTMVYNDANEMLVVMRTKNDWPVLNFPGGHVEPGEDLPLQRSVKYSKKLV